MRILLPPSRTVREGELPPIERYSGTLYKALGVGSWTRAQRAWAERTLVIHSPERGLVPAGEWAPVSPDGVVVDLRSQEYVRRVPVPQAWSVRVLSEAEDGRRLAISHWNKLHKGELVGALVRDRPRAESVRGLLAWAAGAGFRLEREGPRALALLVA